VWDYDQRFKIFLDRMTFHIQYMQHREWLIVGLLSHIQFPFTEQKVRTQAEVVEITMCLEATPGGVKTSEVLAQVQSQVSNLNMQPQDMAKTKFMCKHVWCTACRSEEHRRDECPILPNYVVTGALIPFPTGSQIEWCEIFR
jgi:hypothetical protein